MSGFSLRHLVREVLDARSDLNDPRDLASEVLSQLRPSNYEAVIAQLLPSLVREMIRDSRNGKPWLAHGHSAPTMSVVPALPARALQSVGAGSSGAIPVVGDVAKPRQVFRSAKVAAYQEMGLRWLDDRLYTSHDPRSWKSVGDCGYDDLMFAVAQRREQAARTTAKADEIERMAELVQRHGVRRVRDLPESVLRGIKDVAA